MAEAAASGRRELQCIDALRRAWARNRDDVDALRGVHAVMGERLAELQPTT